MKVGAEAHVLIYWTSSKNQSLN